MRSTPAAPSASRPLEVRLEDRGALPALLRAVFEVTDRPVAGVAAERLEAAGIRPISNVVDITNYVMLELGQPMHAFDLDRLDGRALGSAARGPGERLTTLDGVDARSTRRCWSLPTRRGPRRSAA